VTDYMDVMTQTFDRLAGQRQNDVTVPTGTAGA
jgi:hypothetical protein